MATNDFDVDFNIQTMDVSDKERTVIFSSSPEQAISSPLEQVNFSGNVSFTKTEEVIPVGVRSDK